MRRILLIGGAVIAVASLFGTLGAGGSAPEDATGDAEAERFAERIRGIAMSCAACHGTEARAETAIPRLAGQPEAVVRAQLLAFKADQMPGATVMPRLARGYTNEELAGLARYFSQLDPQFEPEADTR